MSLDLSFYSWELIQNFLIKGLLFSVQLTVVATLGGIAFGTILALMRLSNKPWLTIPASCYVNVMRSIPLVMVILWFFLLIPTLIGRPIGADLSAYITFIAFEAAIALLRETNQAHVIDEVYKAALEQVALPKEQVKNVVQRIYAPFTDAQISAKIAQMLTPAGIQAQVEIIYQSVENLHIACPGHTGDWYFTGNYPTPGGNKVVNRAFINWMEKRNVRAY